MAKSEKEKEKEKEKERSGGTKNQNPPQMRSVVRPEKWDDSQVGFRGSNASGERIVLLPGAFWAHGASKMATLGASLLLCILQCFRA